MKKSISIVLSLLLLGSITVISSDKMSAFQRRRALFLDTIRNGKFQEIQRLIAEGEFGPFTKNRKGNTAMVAALHTQGYKKVCAVLDAVPSDKLDDALILFQDRRRELCELRTSKNSIKKIALADRVIKTILSRKAGGRKVVAGKRRGGTRRVVKPAAVGVVQRPALPKAVAASLKNRAGALSVLARCAGEQDENNKRKRSDGETTDANLKPAPLDFSVLQRDGDTQEGDDSLLRKKKSTEQNRVNLFPGYFLPDCPFRDIIGRNSAQSGAVDERGSVVLPEQLLTDDATLLPMSPFGE